MNKRFQFGIGQLGIKPGAKYSLSLLLERQELPCSRWKQLDQRTWRYGFDAKTNEISARARSIKSIAAWRSFQGDRNWLWIQLIPFASSEDAKQAMPRALDTTLSNLRAKVKLVSQHLVDLETEVDLNFPTFTEQKSVNAKGEDASAKYVSATVGKFGFIISGSSFHNQTWDQVLEIAVLQSNKIKTLTMTKDDV